MADTNDDQALVLYIESRLKGAAEIDAGTAASDRFAKAEKNTERAIRSATGVYEKRVRLQKELNDAIERGEKSERIADLKRAQYLNQRLIDRTEKPPAKPVAKEPRAVTPPRPTRPLKPPKPPKPPKPVKPPATAGDRLRDAVFSSRFSVGGTQPLIGRWLDAVSPALKDKVGQQIKEYGDTRAARGQEGNSHPAMQAAQYILNKFSGGKGAVGGGIADVLGGIGGEGAGGGIAGAASGAIEGLGGLAAAVAPAAPLILGIAFLAKKGYDAAVSLAQAAVAASQITQSFSDLQAKVGGTAADAAQARIMSRITGVDAGSASRSLRERITSDGLSMGIAARYGVRALPGPYGQRNFGKQYQDLIERLASNPNRDQAMRDADQLGIGQEVQRYSLLSGQTKDALRNTAGTSERVNNPAAQRRAAELQAAMQNLGEASDNLKTAWGNLFNAGWMPTLLNDLAGVENWLADKLTQLRGGVSDSAGSVGAGGLSGGSGANGNSSSMSLGNQQVQAMTALVGALNGLNRTIIGGGPNAQNAYPNGLRGANLAAYAQASNMGLVHLGAMGANG